MNKVFWSFTSIYFSYGGLGLLVFGLAVMVRDLFFIANESYGATAGALLVLSGTIALASSRVIFKLEQMRRLWLE